MLAFVEEVVLGVPFWFVIVEGPTKSLNSLPPDESAEKNAKKVTKFVITLHKSQLTLLYTIVTIDWPLNFIIFAIISVLLTYETRAFAETCI